MEIILFIFLSLLAPFVAAETTALTLDKLEKNNYGLMSGNEISEIILGKTVVLKDLLSQAVYEVKINKNGSTEKKQITAQSPKTLTNIEYHSRAALLGDKVKIILKGNKIITTDGVRTYISSLYRKGDYIYAVRDIDNNAVNFQLIINK